MKTTHKQKETRLANQPALVSTSSPKSIDGLKQILRRDFFGRLADPAEHPYSLSQIHEEIDGCGSKRKAQRGPQVVGSIFPFTNLGFLRYPFFAPQRISKPEIAMYT